MYIYIYIYIYIHTVCKRVCGAGFTNWMNYLALFSFLCLSQVQLLHYILTVMSLTCRKYKELPPASDLFVYNQPWLDVNP